MDQFLKNLGVALRSAIIKINPPRGNERLQTKKIYEALESTEGLVAKRLGGPVFHRYRGRRRNQNPSYSATPQKSVEYLWDFSFTRFAIPQATEKPGKKKIPKGKHYELLLVAESELGTSNEICRDLLKVLEARCMVRCLIYRRPRREAACRALHERMIRVMRNHAHFRPASEMWLLVGVEWACRHITCETHTVNKRGTSVVRV
ncbi:MAG: hypothetical protein HY701_10905 [Gemmatimonadetes bacterium]|nr:hypothetical protein [Gemmatimonadota bacterium]